MSARSPSATSSEISAAMLLVSLPTSTVDNSVVMSPPVTAKGEAKNDYTAAIVGGSIAGVILILCISAVAFVMFLRLRKDGS